MRKLAVISGGSRGIGRAIAEKMAENGLDVAISGRSIDTLLEAKKEIESKGVVCHIEVADNGNKEEVLAWAQKLKDLNQEIGALVLNAGQFQMGSLEEEPDGSFERMMEINVYGSYHLSKALLPQMIAVGQGHIFVMCSVASFIAHPLSSAYTISKFALFGLSKVLREELKKQQIRVTALLPGATETDSWKDVPVESSRLMKKEDIADLVWAAYAISPLSVVEELIVRPQLGDLMDIG